MHTMQTCSSRSSSTRLEATWNVDKGKCVLFSRPRVRL